MAGHRNQRYDWRGSVDMIEKSRFAPSYNEAHDAILISLRELASSLRERLKSPFKYRFVSQVQASPVARTYHAWVKSGEVGEQPVIDAASFRSAIYSQAAAARQLEAFVNVSRVLAFDLCQASIRGFEDKEVAVPYMMLRGLLERTAHVAALAEALQPLAQAMPPSDEPNRPLIEVGDKIFKALYGTKIDWQKLSNIDLRTAGKEEVAYVRNELTMDDRPPRGGPGSMLVEQRLLC